MFLPGSRRTFSESVYLLLIGSEIWTVNLFLSGLRTIWFAIIESTVYLKSLVADVIKFLVFFWCSRWTRDFICREILSLPLISQSGRFPVSTTTLLKRYKNVFGMLGKHFIKRYYNVILCGFFNVVITFLLTLYCNVFKTFLENILKTFLKTLLQR